VIETPFLYLGYNNKWFYYRVKATGCIVRLGACGHNKSHLIGLAALSYWAITYPGPMKGKNCGINWALAASTMIQEQRKVGLYLD
jgi:hypothetical protein